MKSQENIQHKYIVNFSRYLHRLMKHEGRDAQVPQAANEFGHRLGCELGRIWCNGCPYISRVSQTEIAEMFYYCKQHPEVKYVFFDYQDRFACTNVEVRQRERLFERLGVTVLCYGGKEIPRFEKTMNDIMNLLDQENYEEANLCKMVEEMERHNG